MKIYKKCNAEKSSFLINNTNLPPDNPSRFGKNILD